MPESWTGDLVGRMHNAQITYEELGGKMGCCRSYVSKVLNGKRNPKGIRERMERAVDAIIAERAEVGA